MQFSAACITGVIKMNYSKIVDIQPSFACEDRAVWGVGIRSADGC
jgi:hypothetical protein